MACKPVALDHVNIYVRNAERSHRWYTDVLGLHTQDTFTSAETDRLRAVFLSADPDHAHDIALFEVGDDAAGSQKQQVGLNHVAWRMESLDDLNEMYQRLNDRERRRPAWSTTPSRSASTSRIPTGTGSRSTTSCRAASGTRTGRSRIRQEGPLPRPLG